MTRTPAKAADLRKLGAEIIAGDLHDPDSLARACQGVEQVLTTAHGFEGQGKDNPRTVDYLGNRNLIHAAKAAGVKHFIFTSVHDARPDHMLEFFRFKYATEQYLRDSGLVYTILRPSAFMEFWATLIGEPVIKTGKTTIFGRGENPINFVSADDVAKFALVALENPRARNQIIEIGGPENLTLKQVAAIFEGVARRPAKKSHAPLPMMRVMTLLMRPVNPVLSRQIAAGIYLDTANQTLDMTNTLKQFPMPLTHLEDFARKTYG